MKTNYRLKDGDTVELLVNARVDGYWYDSAYMLRGSWDSHFMLKGCIGKIVKARGDQPMDGKTAYFANVDIEYMGKNHRVRMFHNEIRKVKVK